jgi:hypothetical protein
MTDPTEQGARWDETRMGEELPSLSGLRASASDHEVDAAHNGLVTFLELASHEEGSWAAARGVDVDKAEGFGIDRNSDPAKSVVTHIKAPGATPGAK